MKKRGKKITKTKRVKKGKGRKIQSLYKFSVGDSVKLNEGANKGIEGVITTIDTNPIPFDITIKTDRGHILHGIKGSQLGLVSKGEVYHNHNGNYLTLVPSKSGLTIKLDENGKEKIEEDGISEQNFDDYFEDIRGNSEYLYFMDAGEAGLVMTSAPAITDGYYYDDDGKLTDKGHEDSKVYVFMRYETTDFTEELKKDGEVFFQLAPKFKDGGGIGNGENKVWGVEIRKTPNGQWEQANKVPLTRSEAEEMKRDFEKSGVTYYGLKIDYPLPFKEGGEIGNNTYKAFYKGKNIEVKADTSLAARNKAAELFKAKKAYDVTVVLLAVGDREIIHSTAEFQQGGGVKNFEKGERLKSKDITSIKVGDVILRDNLVKGVIGIDAVIITAPYMPNYFGEGDRAYDKNMQGDFLNKDMGVSIGKKDFDIHNWYRSIKPTAEFKQGGGVGEVYYKVHFTYKGTPRTKDFDTLKEAREYANSILANPDTENVEVRNHFKMEQGGLAQNKRYEYNQLPQLFNKGDKFRVHGWIMLKGVDEGDYEVTESSETAVKFVKLLRSGQKSTKTPLHFRKSDLLGSLDTYLRGDNNGVELLQSANVPIITKYNRGGIVKYVVKGKRNGEWETIGLSDKKLKHSAEKERELFNESLKKDGANEHLGENYRVSDVKVVNQFTGDVVDEYKAPMFEAFEQGGVTESTLDAIYKKYADKDYWWNADAIKNKVAYWKELIAKGDEEAKKYTEQDIIDSYMTRQRIGFDNHVAKMKEFILSKNKEALKSHVRYDQKLSKELYSLFSGDDVSKMSNKELSAYFDKKYPQTAESGGMMQDALGEGWSDLSGVNPSKIEVEETMAYGFPDKLILKYNGKKIALFHFNMRGYREDFYLQNKDDVQADFGERPKSTQISAFKRMLKDGFVYIKQFDKMESGGELTNIVVLVYPKSNNEYKFNPFLNREPIEIKADNIKSAIEIAKTKSNEGFRTEIYSGEEGNTYIGYSLNGGFRYGYRYRKEHNITDKIYEEGGSFGDYVAVGETKDGYWVIVSKPTTKEIAESMLDSVPKNETGKVVTLEEARSHKKVLGKEYLYAGGGKVSNSLVRGVLNDVSSGYIGSRLDDLGYTTSLQYADIDRVRAAMVNSLVEHGDEEYSISNLNKLIEDSAKQVLGTANPSKRSVGSTHYENGGIFGDIQEGQEYSWLENGVEHNIHINKLELEKDDLYYYLDGVMKLKSIHEFKEFLNKKGLKPSHKIKSKTRYVITNEDKSKFITGRLENGKLNLSWTDNPELAYTYPNENEAMQEEGKMEEFIGDIRSRVVPLKEIMKDGGGVEGEITEKQVIDLYMGASSFPNEILENFKIKRKSIGNDQKAKEYIEELKQEGYSVKKKSYSDFTAIMAVRKKSQEELAAEKPSRIYSMVQGWNEDGRAFSNVNNDDSEFFRRVGVPLEKMGITSQTGNDIVYYDTTIYSSDTNALKSRKFNGGGAVVDELTDEEIDLYGTTMKDEWEKYNKEYKDKIKYATYSIPSEVAVFNGKEQISRKWHKMYGGTDHIKKAFDYIESNKKLAKEFPKELPMLAGRTYTVVALTQDSYKDGYHAYKRGGVLDEYEIGDLVFARHEGSRGLVGLVISEKHENLIDVYFRGYNGDILEVETSDIEPLLEGHLDFAENNGDISAYSSIAKKRGITLNPAYEEALQEEEGIMEDEYAGGGDFKKMPEKGSPEWHQLQIARKTVKMNPTAIQFMGGMTLEEAEAILNKYGIKYAGGGGISEGVQKSKGKKITMRKR